MDSILEQLSKDENNPLHSFWWSIRYQYDLFKTQLRAQPQKLEPDSGEVDMKTVLEILQPGIICATADKNYGLVILPVEGLIQAETNILNDLGGVLVHVLTEDQIMRKLNLEIANLRKSFMSKFLEDYPTIPLNK